MVTFASRLIGITALTALLGTGTASATPVGTQSFVNIGQTMADGSTTGDIDTATLFVLDELISTAGNSGVFSGMPTQDFGMIAFDITHPFSLMFGDSVFGSFASTSITQINDSPGARSFRVLGNWTPGTFEGVSGGPFGAELTIGLNQTPPTDGGISESVSFATEVPEPASLLLLGSGLGLVARTFRKR